jgi:hypothetical protein
MMAWKRPRFRPLVVLLLCAACYPAAKYVADRRSAFPRAKTVQARPEFQVTQWMNENLPGARALPAGSTRYWYNAWYDDEESYGGSNQGMLSQILPVANWQITQGAEVELAIEWLQALGVDAVIVPDKTSVEVYHDYSHPEKFQPALPAIFNDHKGIVIYRVPRRFAAIARVVERASLMAIGPPRGGDDRETLLRYVSAIEHGPDSSPTVTRPTFESFDVRAAVSAGQAVLLQETFDPAWHAYSDGTALPIQQDALGFMLVAAPVGEHTIHFQFETPLENRIGWVLSVVTFLIVVMLLVRTPRALNPLS